MAQKRLLQELSSLRKEKWVNLRVDEENIFKWRLGLMVTNPDSAFNGAYLKAEMQFSKDYPYAPPSFQFTTRDMNHPNIYSDGRVCISILHNPGEDEHSGEQACERWSPLQGVESVLRSVLLLLDEPEINSPANVDASIMYRGDRAQYDALARSTALSSRKDMPADVVFPSPEELETKADKFHDDDDFWNESAATGFGSESDADFGFGEYDDDGDFDDDDDDDDEDDIQQRR